MARRHLKWARLSQARARASRPAERGSPSSHHALHAVGAGHGLELASAQHVVDVRQYLREGEAHLMGIERALENKGNELGGRARRRATGPGDGLAAQQMMALELAGAGAKPRERQLMAG